MKKLVGWFIRVNRNVVQFFKFQFVAVIAYWSDYGIYALVYTLLFSGNPVQGAVYAKIVSYPVGLLAGYLINKRWTFGVRRRVFSVYLLKYIVVNGCALVANLLAIYILTKYYSVSPYLASMAATAFSFSINYSGNKVWVFE